MDLSRCTRMTDNDKEMVRDAINAVTRAEMWEYMAKPTTPGKDGFMFCTDPELGNINTKMRYGGHSGSSFGWTMRQVEYIAKNGFDAYVDLMNGGPRPPPRAPTPVPSVMPFVEVPPIHNRANTGGASREHMLAETGTTISINDQIKSLANFSDDPMTYSEMRSRYG